VPRFTVCVKSCYKNTTDILAILLGIFCLVSFLQRLFDVGLVPLVRDFIDYYRTIAYFFFDMPARMLGFHFPDALMDMWTLSFIGAAAYIKTPNIENARLFHLYPAFTRPRYWKLMLFCILGLSGLGLAVLFGAFSPITYVDAFHEQPLDLSKRSGINIIWIICGAIVFFLLNAFGPTV
jgi:hypothetical protein